MNNKYNSFYNIFFLLLLNDNSVGKKTFFNGLLKKNRLPGISNDKAFCKKHQTFAWQNVKTISCKPVVDTKIKSD